jgi:alpha-maltose-1-phosphate synthase
VTEPRPRILGLVEGDPASALSAVPRFLLDALDRRFAVVDRVDFGARGLQRLAVAAATVRPQRAIWRARFHTSRLAHRVLSRNLPRRVAEAGAEFDLALQVHGWASGQPEPYALYVDQTRLMAERGWPEWMPFTRRERGELLELERAQYAGAAHLFVMGEPALDSLVADYGADPERISVVGGGLSYEEPPVPGELTGEPSILFIGRDFERKGGEVLLEAFELVRQDLPAARLQIAGASRDFDAPGVIGHGKVTSRAALAELYRGARAFCLPSLYEPYGLVLVEAMAHGIPCVGTEVQSIPEILGRGETGLLVPPGDPRALANALLRLLTDGELSAHLAETGPRWVASELTWDRVAERMAPGLRACF